MIVVGVDGCKKGWVAARWDIEHRTIDLAVYPSFAEVLAAYSDAAAIGIDIPIGLIEGCRACDVEARAVLGKRKSSVFPAPDPRVIDITDYHNANDRLKELCGKGISAQAFGIYSKVAEVNRLMTPDLQSRIIEVHPEISFWAMNGGNEIAAPKKSGPGYLARWNVLRANLDLPESEWKKVDTGIRGAGSDDVLDAVAAAWSARRWSEGISGRFPLESEADRRGLRVEIVY